MYRPSPGIYPALASGSSVHCMPYTKAPRLLGKVHDSIIHSPKVFSAQVLVPPTPPFHTLILLDFTNVEIGFSGLCRGFRTRTN